MRAWVALALARAGRNRDRAGRAKARPAPRDIDEAAVALAREVLAETRQELARADGKASTLLAGALVAAGIIGSALSASHWSPDRLQPLVAALWAAAALGGATCLACLLAVIYPRRRAQSGHHVLGYFDHVREHGAGQLAAGLRARACGSELERLAAKLEQVSGIAARKYALTRLAIWTLAGTAVLVLAGGVASWMLR
jgi:Family of unknown function (DUF5706)